MLGWYNTDLNGNDTLLNQYSYSFTVLGANNVSSYNYELRE